MLQKSRWGGGLRQRTWKSVSITVLVLCIGGCDQATKRIAETMWNDCTTRSLLSGFVLIRYVENGGAFLGMGTSLPGPVRTIALILLPALALVFLSIASLRDSGRGNASVIGWALVAGGGLGNLIDRIARGGLVRDFLNFGIGTLRTGILNGADLAITAGCLLMLVHALRGRKGRCSTSP